MATTEELVKIEKDFLSGRNPLGFIPLCTALRKNRMFTRALDLCQSGLRQVPESVAGRSLLAGLHADLGHYEEALKEIARVKAKTEDSHKLLMEEARCLLKLNRFEEATEILKILDARNPLDGQVQRLNSELRRDSLSRVVALPGTAAQSGPNIYNAQTINPEMILEVILADKEPSTIIIGAAVIPQGAGAPAVHGDVLAAEATYSFYQESSLCCNELDAGKFQMGVIETTACQLIVLVRPGILISYCIQPSPNLGKVLHRLQNVVAKLMHDQKTPKKRAGGD